MDNLDKAFQDFMSQDNQRTAYEFYKYLSQKSREKEKFIQEIADEGYDPYAHHLIVQRWVKKAEEPLKE